MHALNTVRRGVQRSEPLPLPASLSSRCVLRTRSCTAPGCNQAANVSLQAVQAKAAARRSQKQFLVGASSWLPCGKRAGFSALPRFHHLLPHVRGGAHAPGHQEPRHRLQQHCRQIGSPAIVTMQSTSTGVPYAEAQGMYISRSGRWAASADHESLQCRCERGHPLCMSTAWRSLGAARLAPAAAAHDAADGRLEQLAVPPADHNRLGHRAAAAAATVHGPAQRHAHRGSKPLQHALRRGSPTLRRDCAH